MLDKKIKIKKCEKPTSLYSTTPKSFILCLWLSFKEKTCPTPINYHGIDGKKGYKEGLQGQKSYHSKKEKTCPIIKQSCNESVKQTKNIYNLSSESSFSERQSHKEKGGKN